MRKTILIFLSIFVFSFPSISFAAELSQEAGITPDSPLYFFDILGEKINLLLTTKPENKIKLYLKYAEERVAELDKLASENKSKYSTKAVKNFQYNMENASKRLKELKEEGQDVNGLAIILEENALRQQNVLHRVLTQVPDQAKDAIQKAIDTSKKGLEQASEAIQKNSTEQIKTNTLPEVK